MYEGKRVVVELRGGMRMKISGYPEMTSAQYVSAPRKLYKLS
jgi:hypothetical protein